MAKIIDKDKVSELLVKLSDYDIYGPVEEDGLVFYRKLKGEPLLDFENADKPPKKLFFPQTEKMFEFEVEGPKIVDIKEPENTDESPMLLFGIRPCDARAMTVLDKLFTWDYIDPYYVDKRERATIISFSCTQPDMPLTNCFCTSVGGSPSSEEGADMLWTEVGDKYIVESFTDKGEKILESGGKIFSEADEEDERSAEEAKKKAEESIGRKLEIEGLQEALDKSFESDYWEEIAQRCLGCGVCTLLCPTCHCFDINDIVTQGKAWRERTWDSCQYPYYTVHASGHNPRLDKKHRQRNRLYHKFLYMDRNLDVIGCVGCGRCISNCPVDIDIIEVAEGIKEVA